MNASALVIITAMTLASACSSCRPEEVKGPVNRDLPTTTMRLGNERFTLEVADDEREREVGLMNRRAMPADRGMIFVFPEEERRSFYMKNTLIALDIAHFNAKGELLNVCRMKAPKDPARGDVVSIHPMQPLDLTGIPSRAPAKYAIELNLGTAARLGLKPGDRLEIPRDAAHTDR